MDMSDERYGVAVMKTDVRFKVALEDTIGSKPDGESNMRKAKMTRSSFLNIPISILGNAGSVNGIGLLEEARQSEELLRRNIGIAMNIFLNFL